MEKISLDEFPEFGNKIRSCRDSNPEPIDSKSGTRITYVSLSETQYQVGARGSRRNRLVPSGKPPTSCTPCKRANR